jgi:hypothetical protein
VLTQVPGDGADAGFPVSGIEYRHRTEHFGRDIDIVMLVLRSVLRQILGGALLSDILQVVRAVRHWICTVYA